MFDVINYLYRGLIHYLYVLLNMLDFKDYSVLVLLIFGIILLMIINKTVRKSIIGLVKPLVNVIKTPPGIILLILFILYYLFILVYFEDNISFLILLMSIYLLFQSYISVNLNLLTDSDKTTPRAIMDVSFPILLLAFQQVVSMLEFNEFSNWKNILISLIIIPIFSIIFIVLKHFVNYDDFYKKNKAYIKISDYDFFKLYNYSLIKSKTYQNNQILLNKLLKENNNLSLKELKKKIDEIFPEVIRIYDNDNISEKCVRKKKKNSKIFKIFNYIWLFNIIYLVVMIFLKRFTGKSFDFSYYFSYFILLIYFLYDLLRIKSVENQYDFCIYGFMYLIFTILLVFYNFSLKQLRLSEIGFIVPIFVLVRALSCKKNSINFLSLPLLSENNFFGLPPKN